MAPSAVCASVSRGAYSASRRSTCSLQRPMYRDGSITASSSARVMLKAGAAANVTAELKASPKALPGDYVVVMDAKTPEVTADAQFRISVKTPLFWGWVGVLVILAAVGGVYCLFRKYGRR